MGYRLKLCFKKVVRSNVVFLDTFWVVGFMGIVLKIWYMVMWDRRVIFLFIEVLGLIEEYGVFGFGFRSEFLIFYWWFLKSIINLNFNKRLNICFWNLRGYKDRGIYV